MALTLADVGADAILGTFFNGSPVLGHLSLRLYTNDATPTDTNVAGDYTEATGPSYLAKQLTHGSWTLTTGNDPSDVTYTQQTWTFGGALEGTASIYGYYVLNAAGTLLWAERFSSAFTPQNVGDSLAVTPKFALSKGTPT